MQRQFLNPRLIIDLVRAQRDPELGLLGNDAALVGLLRGVESALVDRERLPPVNLSGF